MSRSLQDIISSAWENHHLLSIMLELTYACELKCQFCYNDLGRKGRNLTLEEYSTLLKDSREIGCLYLTLTGGEPTLSRHFFEVGSYARELGYAIRIKTHGSFLDSGLIKRIREEVDPVEVDISIHGDNAETHDALTQVPGSFSRLMRHLELFKKEGLRVTLRCIITKLNQYEIEGILAIGEKFGIPVKSTPEISAKDDGDTSPFSLSPDFDGVVHYFKTIRKQGKRAISFVDEESTDEIREQLTTRYNCGAGTSTLTIDPYGEVLPCVAWRRGVGNVRESSIKEIWQASAALKRVREDNESARKFHLENQEKTGNLVFCPGRAEADEGSPLTMYEDIVKLSLAAEAATLKEEKTNGKERVQQT